MLTNALELASPSDSVYHKATALQHLFLREARLNETKTQKHINT
jgi:hypothetical protein